MQSKANTFNEDARLYDKMRPGYPDAIFTELQQGTGLKGDNKILEVGCGTGQATKNLIKISRNITCIDPGKNLLVSCQ